MSEGLSESSDTCVVVFPREKKEGILPFMTEESSGQETVEGIQEPIIPHKSVSWCLCPTPK